MTRHEAIAALALAALVVAPGCGGAPPRLEDDPAVRAIPRTLEGGRRLRLGVAPIEVAYATTRTAEDAPDFDPGRAPVAPDVAALRLLLCDAIRRHTAFHDVRPVDPAPGGGDLLARALEEGHDALLRVRIDGFHDVFRGRNLAFLPSVLVWYYLWVPSWFIPDETYGAELRGEAVFIDVRSERPIARERIAIETSRALDDFERGWDILGLFRVPGSIDEDGWRKIGESVNPGAMRELERAVVLAAGRLAQPALEPGARAGATFAVIAAVSRYGAPSLPRVAAAERDADAVARYLARAGVPAKNVRRVVGRAATRERIEDAIREAVARAAEDDTVLVYFSGAGTASEDGEPAILGHDADPASPARTGLLLARAKEVIERGRARRAVLVVDAAFGGPAGPRGIPAPGDATVEGASAAIRPAVAVVPARGGASGAGPATARVDGRLARLAPEGGRLVILVAAAPGDTAGDLDGAGLGLFTYHIVDAAADADRDGTTTLAELAAHVARGVPAHAEIEGRAQRPRIYGAGVGAGGAAPWFGSRIERRMER